MESHGSNRQLDCTPWFRRNDSAVMTLNPESCVLSKQSTEDCNNLVAQKVSTNSKLRWAPGDAFSSRPPVLCDDFAQILDPAKGPDDRSSTEDTRDRIAIPIQKILSTAVKLDRGDNVNGDERDFVYVECRQLLDARSRIITHISASIDGKIAWQDSMVGQATALCGYSDVCAIGFADGSLHVVDSCSGTLSAPPFSLGSPVCHLSCEKSSILLSTLDSHPKCAVQLLSSPYMAVVTADASICIWSLRNFELVASTKLPLASCQSLFCQAKHQCGVASGWSVASLEVNELGDIRTTVSYDNGERYHQHLAFNRRTCTWLRSSGPSFENARSVPAAWCQLAALDTQDPHSQFRRLREGVATAMNNQNSNELSHWLRMYIMCLCESDDALKVRKLWEQFVLSGRAHAKFFQSVAAPLLSASPKLAFLLTEFAEQMSSEY
mmetsp:Transcript_8373/g.21566  ORF Transcript_8373/g.21566 Transcript_8373/m.21566 type:complete len:437 (-) Transcript_8373:916-2226(-)